MKESLKMLIMSQLSDALHLIGKNKEANHLINAAKVMLRDLDDKEVDFDEMEKKVTNVLNFG